MFNSRSIKLHVLAWTVFILGNVLRSYFSDHSAGQSIFEVFVIELGYDGVAAICFYMSSLLVAPVLIIRRKYFFAFFLTLTTYFVVVLGRYVLEFHILNPLIGFDNYKGGIPSLSYYLTNVFYFYFPSYFLYGLMYFFAMRWYENTKRHQAIHQERMFAELSFLRAQINPHFLFNSINDIYSLSYQSSPLAPQALLKLSVILRYMLKEGNEETVALSKEVEYLENVIELQQIAGKQQANIVFIKEGYIGHQAIASLLFIAFLENAFKHGVLDDPASPVAIYLIADNHSVKLSVNNRVNDYLKDSTSGIGLKNVKRRLELIYPDKHQLHIEQMDNKFMVELTIKLDS